MNLSTFYTPVILVALIVFTINLIYRRHSKLLYIICAFVAIFTISIRYIQATHGTNNIGGFFENQKDYEANYPIEIAPFQSGESMKNITAQIQRPSKLCSALFKCTRETLLIKAFTPKEAVNFDPSNCIIYPQTNVYTPCVDNLSRTWNVRMMSIKPLKN